MDIIDKIKYWVETAQNDIKCFDSAEKQNIVLQLFIDIANNGNLEYYILEENKGLIVYSIFPDFKGDLSLHELFMFIKSEYRGSYKLFKELINHIETVAKERGCKSIRVGANIHYKDEKILRVMQRLGYKTDVVVKYI